MVGIKNRDLKNRKTGSCIVSFDYFEKIFVGTKRIVVGQRFSKFKISGN